MSDINDGECVPSVGLHKAEYIEICGNRGKVNGVKRVALFCGVLLGVVFAWDVCAVTGAPPSESFEETAQIIVQVDQPLLDHQAMLKVANLQEGYDRKGNVVENSGLGNGESQVSGTELPYAILLAMVGLVGLVPVARRNGGL